MIQDKWNQLSTTIHTSNISAGWWEGTPCIYEKLQLASTEVAEATEGVRKGLMDTHLKHRKMQEVELADTAVRILDIGGRLGVIYDTRESYPLEYYNKSNIAAIHLDLNKSIIHFAGRYADSDQPHSLSRPYVRILDILEDICERYSYDLFTTIQEKLDYNKNRPDHKLENRLKAGGKKF